MTKQEVEEITNLVNPIISWLNQDSISMAKLAMLPLEKYLINRRYDDINNGFVKIESEAGKLLKLEAIQAYLLEHGANDEDLNDEIHVMKGLKTQEQVDKLKAERRDGK